MILSCNTETRPLGPGGLMFLPSPVGRPETSVDGDIHITIPLAMVNLLLVVTMCLVC